MKLSQAELDRIREKMDYVEAHADEGGISSPANLQEMVDYVRKLLLAIHPSPATALMHAGKQCGMLDDLLIELADTGWTVSWAFQYGPGEWRMAIIRYEDIGVQQGSYESYCAFAPTFTEALEDCLSKRAEAVWEPSIPITWAKEPKPMQNLIAALGLRSAPIRRRV